MTKLRPNDDKSQVILVSVDPERDTPDILKSNLEQFDPRFSAMSGTPEQLAAFAKGYRFVYKKVPLQGGNYTMDHSAGVYLYDAKGGFAGTLDPHEKDAVALKKLLKLLQPYARLVITFMNFPICLGDIQSKYSVDRFSPIIFA